MGGLANPMGVFGGDRRGAGQNGQQAAMVAGLPSTQMGAARTAGISNYNQQTQMQQAVAARAAAQAQAQGLGGILQLMAYMHAMNPHAAHTMNMTTPDGTKMQFGHKPPALDQFGGGSGSDMGVDPKDAKANFANYHDTVSNPSLDGSNMHQLLNTIQLHRRLKALMSMQNAGNPVDNYLQDRFGSSTPQLNGGQGY